MSATDAPLAPSIRAQSRDTRMPTLRPDQIPSPIEKAAIILTAIGPELAAGFLRDISETDMERFARTVGGLGRVRQDVLDAVIVEFLEVLTRGPELEGGARAARALLGSVLDEGEVDRLLGGAAPPRSVWERLNDAGVPALAGFLAGEHPQTAAVIVSELRPETAASVLEAIEPGAAQAIVLRLSRVPTLDRRVGAALIEAIDRGFLRLLQRSLSRRKPSELIAGLMNNISSEARDGFLGYLEANEPSLAREVQRTMFTFEDIHVRIRGRDVPTVVRDVPEEDLLKALKLGEAQESPCVAFILENLPRRLADRYVEELAALEPPPRKEGEAAQLKLSRAIQAQARGGAIKLVDPEPAFG